MSEFIRRLFDTSGFPARWYCGEWSEFLGFVHIGSDLAIFAAYMAIPLLLGWFALGKDDVPFPKLIWMFVLFITTCGLVHLVEAVIFYEPVYRLSGLTKAVTAVASWATVAALVPAVPQAFAMRFPHQVEAEVEARTADLLARMREQGLFAAMVEDSDDAILAKDLDGTILSWNRGAQRLYGWSAEEMVGDTVAAIVPEERREELQEIMRAIRRGERVSRLETKRVTREGAVIDVSLSVSPVRDERGVVIGASAIGRDITARKRAERALEERNAEMEAFVYTVSHDLRSPVVTINGFVDVLREDLDVGEPADVQHDLQRIEQAADRMGRLIDDLLALSRAGHREERPERVDVAEVARAVESSLHDYLAEAEAAVVLGELPTLWIDPLWIEQILENLLSNAFKYGCPEPGMQVEVAAEEHGDAVVLRVRDHGPGIPPEDRRRIFELFTRLEADRRGTGVGLAIVARLAGRCGGEAWVDAAEGGGAVFRVRLPKRQAPAT